MHNTYPSPQEAQGWGPPPQPGYSGASSWEQPAASGYSGWTTPDSQPGYGAASNYATPASWEQPAAWGGNASPTPDYSSSYNMPPTPAPWGGESMQAYGGGYGASPSSQPGYGGTRSWEQPAAGGFGSAPTYDTSPAWGTQPAVPGYAGAAPNTAPSWGSEAVPSVWTGPTGTVGGAEASSGRSRSRRMMDVIRGTGRGTVERGQQFLETPAGQALTRVAVSAAVAGANEFGGNYGVQRAEDGWQVDKWKLATGVARTAVSPASMGRLANQGRKAAKAAHQAGRAQAVQEGRGAISAAWR